MNQIIRNQFMTVTISRQGAELQSILGADGTEYLWQADPAYWDEKAPNIFPYVARMTNESYYLDGEQHHMKIHGFAKYHCFAVKEQTETSVVMELTDNEEIFAQYPRKFVFQVIYALAGPRLNITYKVENLDDKTMFFGLGGHPGFNVPLAEELDFSDYRLRFAAQGNPQRVGFTPACFLNGEDRAYPMVNNQIINLRHDLFDEDAIVLKDCIREVTLESDKDSHSITVTFPQMAYLGFWHMPKTDAPYVCIEPWCSLPSTQDQVAVFEEQSDLIHLAAGETYHNQWSITIQEEA